MYKRQGVCPRDAARGQELGRERPPPRRLDLGGGHHADELHDALLSLGVVPAAEVDAAGWGTLAAELLAAGRVTWAHAGEGRWLVAAERVQRAGFVLPGSRFAPAVADVTPASARDDSEEDALASVAGGWLESLGPVTVSELARRLDLASRRVEIGLAGLERSGVALRGRFTPGATEEEWCERRLLARIHRMTLGVLRREIEPVSAADLMRFLFRWQHVQEGTRLSGRDGLVEIIGQLEGLELPARAWEADVLAARMRRYDPEDLDGLCLSGAVVWGRLRADAVAEEASEGAPRRGSGRQAPTRVAPLGFVLRRDVDWLLAPGASDRASLSGDAREVLEHLERRGASFLEDMARGTGLLPAAVEDALWALVARGLVTGDGVAGLRMLLRAGRPERRARLRAVRRSRTRFVPAGRWALLRGGAEAVAEDPIRAARLLLRRWGVIVREMLARETRMPPWRTLLAALRTLEARGEIRGGRFVAGLVGEQFALPEAVETLRAIRRRAPEEEIVVVSAADPLNLVGVLLPGARVPAASREVIAFRDGVPVESGELGEVLSRLGRRAPAAG